MEYYHILDFKKEPFSNSPEPEFLFQSPQHITCLQMLELAVRLRRGLNVVIGDVGTGKTTLCRKLIQNFSSAEPNSPEIETHLLLDPAFAGTREFLQTVALLLGIEVGDAQESEWHLKEKIKNYLFSKGVDEGKIVALIIDEGQKIPEDCLEVLREFLNYETNNIKLLQIIIFAQKEFQTVLKKHKNLTDRVNLLYHLKPLKFSQMRAMIDHRVCAAREAEPGASKPLFTPGGLALIYLATGGYPRKVISLCHPVVLMLIIRGRKKANFFFVKNVLLERNSPRFVRAQWALLGILTVVFAGLLARAAILQGQGRDTSLQIAAAQVVAAPVVMEDPLPALATLQGDENPKNEIPDSLGVLTVKRRMTLSRIIYDIYGSAYKNALFEEIIKSNPSIDNEDIIKAGERLALPALPADAPRVRPGDFMIVLKQGKDLEAVYDFFTNNRRRQDQAPAVFVPTWNKKEGGVAFAVVVDKIFKNRYDAQNAMKQLPSELAAGAKIKSGWGSDQLVFNSRAFEQKE